jgi:hypothetical protein
VKGNDASGRPVERMLAAREFSSEISDKVLASGAAYLLKEEYKRRDYVQVGKPTRKFDCASYVLWRSGVPGPWMKVVLSANDLFQNVLSVFGKEVGADYTSPGLNTGDIVVWGAKSGGKWGRAQHVAAIEGTPGSWILHSKDGIGPVYRKALPPNYHYDTDDDPLYETYPNGFGIWRVDWNKLTITQIPGGSCDAGAPTSPSVAGSGAAGGTSGWPIGVMLSALCRIEYEAFTKKNGERVEPAAPVETHMGFIVLWNEQRRMYKMKWDENWIVGTGLSGAFSNAPCKENDDWIPGCRYNGPAFHTLSGNYAISGDSVTISMRWINDAAGRWSRARGTTSCTYVRK